MMRGHEVIVLEAAGRVGGHVKTLQDPLADGLYADVGAEHFVEQAYDCYWSYVREFGLPPLRCHEQENLIRFINGRMYTAVELADRHNLESMGYNRQEVDYLAAGHWWDLKRLYVAPYLDRFTDEYRPSDAHLDKLDELTFTEFLAREGASSAAIDRYGSGASALAVIWYQAILKIRGLPEAPFRVYRLKGGNQVLPDTFAHKLAERVRLNAPVIGVERGKSAVRVRYRELGRDRSIDADHLVCCMNALMLRKLSVIPAWPKWKAYAIENVGYNIYSRVVFQSKSAFWEQDEVSPNWVYADPKLSQVWRVSEEVATPRAALVATAVSGASAADSLSTFRKLYPGKSENIELAVIQDWSEDPWAGACERVYSRPGQLNKVWPALARSVGRVHFSGSYSDNLAWGMEAACRTALRSVDAIENA
jgi:monoamine oxidase